MITNKRNAGFTLIELMIVVAIIAIIASVAIPKLMSARLSANESAAISTLRSLASAQAQIQSSAAIDGDGDGAGQYGYFGELSGSVPLRIYDPAADAEAMGAAGDELSPSVLSAAFGNVNAAGVVARSGYNFQIWLPDAANAPVAEAEDGGATAEDVVGQDAGEIFWCAYAWPVSAGKTGNRCFFINQEGDLLQFANRAGAYDGATAPAGDAVFTVADDIGSDLGINGLTPQDDPNFWTVVQ